MKCRIFKLCLFLLLGAIINVAVAWGCARFVSLNASVRQSAFQGTTSADRWNIPGADRISVEHFGFVADRSRRPTTLVASSPKCMLLLPPRPTSTKAQDLIPNWARKLALSAVPEQIPEHSEYAEAYAFGTLVFDARGWPLLAFRGSAWQRTPHIDWSKVGKAQPLPKWNSAVPIGKVSPLSFDNPDSIRFLPYAPIWPGFAINTIFYAAILWLLFAFPFALRRRRRIKRGLCPACAYPVGDSAVCTECGKAVKR